MATKETTSPEQAPKAAPTALAIKQADMLLQHIASEAHAADRSCFFAHGDFDGSGPVDPEQVSLEMDRLRAVIVRLGWMADVGSAKLTGLGGPVRGDAERWLLFPTYVELIDEADAEAKHV